MHVITGAVVHAFCTHSLEHRARSAQLSIWVVIRMSGRIHLRSTGAFCVSADRRQGELRPLPFAGVSPFEGSRCPAPLHPLIQGDKPNAPKLTPTPAGPSRLIFDVRVRASRLSCVLPGNSPRKNGSPLWGYRKIHSKAVQV